MSEAYSEADVAELAGVIKAAETLVKDASETNRAAWSGMTLHARAALDHLVRKGWAKGAPPARDTAPSRLI